MFLLINLTIVGCLTIFGSFQIIYGKQLAAETNEGKIVFNETNEEKIVPNICTSSECQDFSNFILNNINKTADPCNDFYNYACGSWIANNPVPKGEMVWSENKKWQKRIQNVLIEILQEEPKADDSVPLSVEKKLFKACMDEDRIERKGTEGLSKVIEGLGGWPIVMEENKWKEADFPWQKVMQGYIQRNIKTPLFVLSVYKDTKNSSIKRIRLKKSKGNIIFNLKMYERALESFEDELDTIIGLSEKVEKLFVLPGYYARNTPNYTYDGVNIRKTRKLISFLLEFIPMEASHSGEEKNKMTIREFQNYYNRNKSTRNTSEINWLEMIQAFAKGSKLNFDDSEEIIIYGDKTYFDALFGLLDKTPHDEIVNYLHWNFMSSNLLNSNKFLRDFAKGIGRTIRGGPERTNQCEHQLLLKNGVSKEYLKRNFLKSVSESVKEAFEDIRNELDSSMSRANWMDAAAKLLTREKLRAMKIQTVHPEYYDNDSEFNKLYDGLEVGLDHFDNLMRINEFERIQDANEFREPFKGNEWYMEPLTASAHYVASGNRITIAAGILIPTTYNNKELMLLNYGSFGFVIGHEMSHGFGPIGYKYDKEGNLGSLWSDKFEKDFQKKPECFVKQYNDYGVNGELTKSENIADGSGLNIAFSAFVKKAEKFRDIKLPNLENVTRNQLFFLSLASSLCESATNFYENLYEKHDHTIPHLRVNGAVANVKGFAEAFQCPENSHMNPTNRCIVWD